MPRYWVLVLVLLVSVFSIALEHYAGVWDLVGEELWVAFDPNYERVS